MNKVILNPVVSPFLIDEIRHAKATIAIVAYSQDNTEIARWNFENAWPSKVIGPDMDSGSTNFMVEDVTIVHEGVERVS